MRHRVRADLHAGVGHLPHLAADVIIRSSGQFGADAIAEPLTRRCRSSNGQVLDRLEYSLGHRTSRRVIGERDRVQAELLQAPADRPVPAALPR